MAESGRTSGLGGTSATLLRRQLAYASKATLMLSCPGQGGYKRSFCGLSRKPEVTGGKCLGVFCYVPRDLSNGTWIIAIGHHSRKLGRRVCFSVCLFVCLSVCYANFSNFAKGYRPEFSTCQAEIFFRQSPRSNLKTILKIGGLGPP